MKSAAPDPDRAAEVIGDLLDHAPGHTPSAARGRFFAAHKRLSFFRHRWRLRHGPDDPRPWFEASIIFQARDMAQAEFLFERMTDDALDCNRHGPDEPCPHFRVGGLHQVDNDD